MPKPVHKRILVIEYTDTATVIRDDNHARQLVWDWINRKKNARNKKNKQVRK